MTSRIQSTSLKPSKSGKPIKSDNPIKPDAKQMRDFIRLIHQSDLDAPVWFQTYSKAAELVQQSQSFSSSVGTELRKRLIAANTTGMNVSMAVNSIDGRSRSRRSSNVTAINAVFIDIDSETPTLEDLCALPVPPNIVVETSPQHYHAYWLVRGCDIGQFSAVQRALAQRFNSDTSISDAARVMRLPGTVNWKRTTPFLARVVFEHSRNPIGLNALLRKLDLTVDTLHMKVKPAKSTTSTLIPTNTNGSEVGLNSALDTVGTGALEAEIELALDRINSDDRATWLRVGMAIHSIIPTERGYALWTRWSRSGTSFDEQDQRHTWAKLKSPGTGGSVGTVVGNGIGIGTLFWLADMHGKSGGGGGWDNFSMGKLFAKNFCNQLRYDGSMDAWYAFNGVAWTVDKKAPLRRAKTLIEDLCAGDGKRQDGLSAYRSAGGLNTILRIAELEDDITANATTFDRDVNVLALKNGVVDLVTGDFRAARADEFLRRQADVEFVSCAKCPLWLEFIRQVTCGDRGLALFLRIAVGYTLFGHAKAQVFFVLDGPGSNGKGVFLRTLVAILGQYASELAPNIVTSVYAGNANNASAPLMMLKGLRLGIVTELPSKKGFDTAFVKQYAGGDSITARPLHGEMVTFKPEGKLWISTNDMPEIAANDHAMWRRVVPIPFKATFAGDKRDNDLEDKLLLERSGILNWALAGAREFAATGKLIECEAVAKHKERMRRDADVFGSWLTERCVPDAQGKVQSAEAYASYAAFAKKTGRYAMGMPAFGMRMAKEGFQRKSTKRFNVFVGLVLKQ